MNKIRIGIIGVRGRGKIAEYWHKPDGNSVVVAGADINEDHLKQFRDEVNPDAFTTTDYRALLERNDIDAVAITSPDHFHEEHAVAALQAGKHVFCEKPLAITTEGCDRIMREWKKSGKQLMVGFNMRYSIKYQTMKEIIDSGAIGDIKAVWVRHFVGRGGDFYYHDWHANSANTTSLLLQKGSHDIDIIHWLTGQYTKKVSAFGSLDYFGGDKPNDLTCPACAEKDTCPEAQFNSRIQCAFRREVDVEDNNSVIMQLDGGIQASYLQCHFTPDYHRNYTFIGTKGRLENLEPENQIRVTIRKTSTVQAIANRTYDIHYGEGTHSGSDPVMCNDFVEMILNNKPPVATPLAGRMSVAVGCAAAQSIRSGGGVVDIAPAPITR